MMQEPMDAEPEITQAPAEAEPPKNRGGRPKGSKNKPPSVPGEVGEAAKILAMLKDLPPDQVVALQKAGCVFPMHTEGSDPDTVEWGYRCNNCNKVTVAFPGTQWADATGHRYSSPQPGMRFDSLAWIPYREGGPVHEQYDRREERCANCSAEIRLTPSGGLHPKHIVHIDTWIRSRDAADRAEWNRRMNPNNALPPNGTGEAIPVNDPTIEKGVRPMSEKMEPHHREALQQFSQNYDMAGDIIRGAPLAQRRGR